METSLSTKAAALFQRAIRRALLVRTPADIVRASLLRIRGASIGRGTRIPPRTQCTWPHQVRIGCDCVLQPDIFFNYDHYWQPGPSMEIGDRVFLGRGCEFNIRDHIRIGDDVLIASGVKFVDHDHGTAPNTRMRLQQGPAAAIEIEDDVWIGANAVLLKGVTLGLGSVIAAGAVVNRSVPPMEIWGGVPAKRISNRDRCQPVESVDLQLPIGTRN